MFGEFQVCCPPMLARVQSYLLEGIDARSCEVEIDIDESIMDPKNIVVGLPDAAVKEAVERVRAAVMNSGYYFPGGRKVINLAPADVRKEGNVYDLPMSLGMLSGTGSVRTTPNGKGEGIDFRKFLIGGELA